jgi:3D (Asp-Asp-Asp) domain-containing protein
LGSPRRAGPDLVGIAVAPGGHGYWAVAASGAVFAYGDAKNYGSVKHYAPARPVAGIVATPSGHGYWVLSGRGGVFSFGDAHYYGSLGKRPLSAGVVCMAATPDGRGYWLVTAKGHVYTFGDARFYGSLSTDYPKVAVRGIAPTPSGRGYWLATASGHVYSFGTARYHGSMAVPIRTKRRTSSTASSPITLSAIATAAGGRGYWLLASDGMVHGYGAAPDFAEGHTVTGVTASALASTSDGRGYVLATTGLRQKATTHKRQGIVDAARRKGPASELVREAALTFLGSFLVTCYDLTGVTASGEMAGPESIAVDPSVIPLGTQIYVQGVGLRTADDTGGAIIGDHVDIWEPTYYACANWGAQVRAVYRVGS